MVGLGRGIRELARSVSLRALRNGGAPPFDIAFGQLLSPAGREDAGLVC